MKICNKFTSIFRENFAQYIEKLSNMHLLGARRRGAPPLPEAEAFIKNVGYLSLESNNFKKLS